MKKVNVQYGLVGFVIGAIVVWTWIFVAGQNTTVTYTQAAQSLDAHFIEQMIPHHEDAITMSKLALQKAQRQEVKKLAQSIINSQGKEITQMKDWYKSWFGRELPTGDGVMSQHGMMGPAAQKSLHMGVMGNETDVALLENATDFDRAFVEEMIPHHQMAVMMAQMLKSGTNRPEMKQLADNVVTAQTDEIEQMRSWLQSW